MHVTEAERAFLEETVIPLLEDRLDGHTVVDLFDEVEDWRAAFEGQIEKMADGSKVPRISDTPPTCLLSIPRYFVVDREEDVSELADLEESDYVAAIDPGLKHVEVRRESLMDAFREPVRTWNRGTEMESFSYLKGMIDISEVTYSIRTDWRFHSPNEGRDLVEEDVRSLVDGKLREDADTLLEEGYRTLLWSPVFALQALLVVMDEKPAASFFGRVSNLDMLDELVSRFMELGLNCAVRRLEIGEHPPYVEMFIARERIEGRPFLEGEMDAQAHRKLGRFLGYPEDDVASFVERERREETLRDEWDASNDGFDLHRTIAEQYDLGEGEMKKIKALTYYGIRDSREAVERALETAERRYSRLEDLEEEHGVPVLDLVEQVVEPRTVPGYRDEKQLLDEQLLPWLEEELEGLQVLDMHEEMERLLVELEQRAESEVYTGFMPVIEMPVQGMIRSYSIPEYFVVPQDRSVEEVPALWEKDYVASIDIGLKHVELVQHDHEEVFERFGERWEQESCLKNLLGFVKRPIDIGTTTYTYH